MTVLQFSSLVTKTVLYVSSIFAPILCYLLGYSGPWFLTLAICPVVFTILIVGISVLNVSSSWVGLVKVLGISKIYGIIFFTGLYVALTWLVFWLVFGLIVINSTVDAILVLIWAASSAAVLTGAFIWVKRDLSMDWLNTGGNYYV
jgi:hypothetical protein